MKTKRIINCAVLGCMFFSGFSGCRTKNPPIVKNWSVDIANTFMKRYPDPMKFPDPDWTYAQGYMLMGMEKLWSSTHDQKYYDYMMQFVNSAVDSAGHIKKFNGNSLDNMMAGAIVVWAYHETGSERYKKAADQIRRAFDYYPRTSDSLFWHGKSLKGQVWIDGVFMGQLFLTKYGKFVTDSTWCFNEAARQLTGIYYHLKKGNTGLLLHGWDESHEATWADKITGLSREVWSEGLGWYSLTLVETLDLLPKDQPQRAELESIARELMHGLKNYQDSKTGLWYDIVDKGAMKDNFCDPSGSAMFLYAIKKSVEMGLINTDEFEPVIVKGYNGLITKAWQNKTDGLIDITETCNGVCIQDNYNDYVRYDRTLNAKEAIVGFLWGSWIIEKPGSQIQMQNERL